MWSFLLLLLTLDVSHASEPPVFNYVKTLEIEPAIAEHDNLFILFFNKKDGSTEDVQREFLKAKQLLAPDGIEISVLEYNGILSQRLETMLNVYKYPKHKFFKKGRASESYDGPIKAPVIKAWVKTRCRKRAFMSSEANTVQDLVRYLSEGESSLVVYWGEPTGKLFNTFEQLAKRQQTVFIWTQNNDNRLILEHIQKEKFIAAEDFSKIQKSDTSGESSILNASTEEANSGASIYFLKKRNFSRNFLFAPTKTQSSNLNELSNILDSTFKSSFLKGFDEYFDSLGKSASNARYAFLLFKSVNMLQISKIYSKLSTDNRFNQIILADIHDTSSRNGLSGYLKHQGEAFFIVEIDDKEKHRKFKLELDFADKDTQSRIQQFTDDVCNRIIEEYVRTKAVEDEPVNGIRELNSLNFEKHVIANTGKPCLVIFFGHKQDTYKLVANYISQHMASLNGIDLFSFDVVNNEIEENFSNKNLPYLRIYDETRKTYENIAYTANTKVFEAFLSKYFTQNEL